jgi:hypothetical protein
VNLPVATSISSFNVLITSTSGTTQTYNNNGSGGFPVSDSVIVQTPQSCVSNGNLTVVAAVSFHSKCITFPNPVTHSAIGPKQRHISSKHDYYPESSKEFWIADSFTCAIAGQFDHIHGTRSCHWPVYYLHCQLLDCISCRS